jgi:hypothetical protein
MYARFLAECGHPDAELAADTAACWTALAGALLAASESEAPDPGHWRTVGDAAAAVLEAEERLWPALLDPH